MATATEAPPAFRTIPDSPNSPGGDVPAPPQSPPGATTADDTSDPGAPYGRKSDGTPRAKPGRKSSGASERPASTTSTRTKGPTTSTRPKSTTSTRTTSTKSRGPDYRPAVRGLVAIPATACAMAGAATRRIELTATAATLEMYSEPLAEVGHELATEYAPVARALERAEQAGVIGVLLATLVPLGAQVAANFGLIPPGAFGTRDPAEMVAEYMAQRGAPTS